MPKWFLFILLFLVGCGPTAAEDTLTTGHTPTLEHTTAAAPPSPPSPIPSPTPPALPGEIAQMRVEIMGTRPHDPTAFTQGLIYHNGFLYESTGLYGSSSLRQVNPQTGETIQQHTLEASYFGEGLERVENRLIQLTWREQTAFVYDLDNFTVLQTFTYEGEGWGLCYDGVKLYMSNGSDRLTVRHPETFAVQAEIAVTQAGQPVARLNELECVGGTIFANIWQTDRIVQIDKTSGQVIAVIDAAGLLTAAEQAQADVLNGIVYLPESDTFLITGKLWPWVFEVIFIRKED